MPGPPHADDRGQGTRHGNINSRHTRQLKAIGQRLLSQDSQTATARRCRRGELLIPQPCASSGQPAAGQPPVTYGNSRGGTRRQGMDALRDVPRLAARQVKGRHRIPVIREAAFSLTLDGHAQTIQELASILPARYVRRAGSASLSAVRLQYRSAHRHCSVADQECDHAGDPVDEPRRRGGSVVCRKERNQPGMTTRRPGAPGRGCRAGGFRADDQRRQSNWPDGRGREVERPRCRSS